MGLNVHDVLKGQRCPYEYELNLSKLMKALLTFEDLLRRGKYLDPLVITSGYRTPEKNQEIGGASKSPHLSCEGVDFSDRDGKLFEWCRLHQGALVQSGLYLIDPSCYPEDRHLHAQIRPPKSGNRIFIA